MIPIDGAGPRAPGSTWAGLLARARLRAWDLEDAAKSLCRIEDVVPESELSRLQDLLEEFRPSSVRRRRSVPRGSIVRSLPGLRSVFRLREELAAIAEFCEVAATAFGDLARRVEELERRLEQIETR